MIVTTADEYVTLLDTEEATASIVVSSFVSWKNVLNLYTCSSPWNWEKSLLWMFNVLPGVFTVSQ